MPIKTTTVKCATCRSEFVTSALNPFSHCSGCREAKRRITARGTARIRRGPRLCQVCEKPIPKDRADHAVTCSDGCRQWVRNGQPTQHELDMVNGVEPDRLPGSLIGRWFTAAARV